MLRAYVPDKDRLKKIEPTDSMNLPLEAVWIDLEQPTRAEELLVEKTLGIEVPTRQEMQEIEASSRLYREADAWYMTATVIVMADTPHPEGTAITFF